MSVATTEPGLQVLTLSSDLTAADRRRHALEDGAESLRNWRLAGTLAWLDIRLRYRGSILGPFWLTLSTAVMVVAMGVLYATLFRMNLQEYLPFLALSLVLWNAIGAMVGDACTCFTQVEGTIRSVRTPFGLHAIRAVLRNMIVLAHNIPVIVGVYLFFLISPGLRGAVAIPGLLLWGVDGLAAALALGAVCARFRDVPPIIGSVMQIMFFLTPIIWKPELVGSAAWLPFNPFYGLIEVVRAPLLGSYPDTAAWASALIYSAVLCTASWLAFARVRGRLAFWV